MCPGSLFQKRDPATQKDLAPYEKLSISKFERHPPI